MGNDNSCVASAIVAKMFQPPTIRQKTTSARLCQRAQRHRARRAENLRDTNLRDMFFAGPPTNQVSLRWPRNLRGT